MEGGPTQFQEHSPEQRRETYQKYVSTLMLTPEEKDTLLSVPTETRMGELVLTLKIESNDYEEKVAIDPTRTELERIDDITDALQKLFDITLDQKERDVFSMEDDDEEFTIEFREARLH